MASRSYSSGAYRFGFNGKEKDNENFEGAYDFGARIYDGRLGRWLAVDNLRRLYSELSGFQFSGNTPIQAIDPDGRLIIFINGLYGLPNMVFGGGTKEYWGADWISNVQRRVSDYNAMYFDGSLGGTAKYPDNNDQALRKSFGYLEGISNAEEIINGLAKNSDGEIVEPIRFITNSMGAAYQRGFSQALVDYVKIKNSEIQLNNIRVDAEIAGLRSEQQSIIDNLAKGLITSEAATLAYTELEDQIKQAETKYQKEISITIEWVLDIDPHQTNTADPNASYSFFSRSDDNAINIWEATFVERPYIVEGAIQIPTKKGQGHHSGWFEEDSVPTGYGPGAGVAPGNLGSENNISKEHPR